MMTELDIHTAIQAQYNALDGRHKRRLAKAAASHYSAAS